MAPAPQRKGGPVQQRAVEKRRHILEAASDICAKKGFQGVTIEEIARLAGVGKGTVYEYFPSKEALFHELLEAAAASYAAVVTSALEGAGPIHVRLVEMVRSSIEHIEGNRSLARLILMQPAGISAASWIQTMWTARDICVRAVQAALAEAMDRGEMRRADAAVAALAFFAASHFCALQRLSSPDSPTANLPPEQVAEALVDLFLSGLDAGMTGTAPADANQPA